MAQDLPSQTTRKSKDLVVNLDPHPSYSKAMLIKQASPIPQYVNMGNRHLLNIIVKINGIHIYSNNNAILMKLFPSATIVQNETILQSGMGIITS